MTQKPNASGRSVRACVACKSNSVRGVVYREQKLPSNGKLFGVSHPRYTRQFSGQFFLNPVGQKLNVLVRQRAPARQPLSASPVLLLAA